MSTIDRETGRRSLLQAWLLVGVAIVLCTPLSSVVFAVGWRSDADRRLALAALVALLILAAAGCYAGLRRILGAPIARTALVPLLPTLLATQLGGLAGVAGGLSFAPALLFAWAGLGALIGLIWGSWSGRRLRGALAGAAAALPAAAGVAWLNQRLCAAGCPLDRPALGALSAGVIGAALALGVAPAILGLGPRQLARLSAADSPARATPRPWLRWAAPAVAALAALNLAGATLAHGLQPCGWLDLALGRSGCYRSFGESLSVQAIALAPDGGLLAHTYYNYDAPDREGILLRRADDGAILYDLPFEPRLPYLRFSPDGQLLAAAEILAGQITVWSVADGAPRYTLREPQGALVAFSPDGAELLTLTARYRASDGALLGPLPKAELGDKSVAATGGVGGRKARSPDRSLVAAAGPDARDARTEDGGWIELRDRAGALLMTIQGAPGEDFRDLWFSPDGTMLAASVNVAGRPMPLKAELHIFRLSDGARIRRIVSDQGFNTAAWGSDSRTIVAWESYGRGALFFRVGP